MKLLFLLLLACSTPAPKTPESMLAYRLSHTECERTCPVGHAIDPVEPQETHVFADCCIDPLGITWSACAWNVDGRYMSPEQLMESSRLAGNCGGDGFPDCGAR